VRIEAGTGLIPSLLIHLTRARSIPRDQVQRISNNNSNNSSFSLLKYHFLSQCNKFACIFLWKMTNYKFVVCIRTFNCLNAFK
jgi:hypothetical protein